MQRKKRRKKRLAVRWVYVCVHRANRSFGSPSGKAQKEKKEMRKGSGRRNDDKMKATNSYSTYFCATLNRTQTENGPCLPWCIIVINSFFFAVIIPIIQLLASWLTQTLQSCLLTLLPMHINEPELDWFYALMIPKRIYSLDAWCTPMITYIKWTFNGINPVSPNHTQFIITMCDRFKLASWYISSLSLLLETFLGLQGAQPFSARWILRRSTIFFW